MENGVGNRGRSANERKLAEALRTYGVHVRIVLLDETNFEIRDIEIYRNEIVGHVCVDHATITRVENGTFHECHPDTADHPTNALTGGQKWVNCPTNAIHAQYTADLNDSKIGIDGDLREYSPKRIH